jgi:hypothetical protein
VRAIIRGARVAGESRIAAPVAIRVSAGVTCVSDPIAVAVRLALIIELWTVVTRVPDAVMVGVGLIRVGDEGAIIDRTGIRRMARVSIAISVSIRAGIDAIR